MSRAEHNVTNPVATGIVLLSYAVLGNYVALPGYVRFLGRGGTSAGGNSFDLAVLIGAVKTILWMYSFQLGVLALALAYSAREGLHTKQIAVAGSPGWCSDRGPRCRSRARGSTSSLAA